MTVEFELDGQRFIGINRGAQFSWQVVPTGMEELFSDPDKSRAERAMRAMLEMGKLDIATLRRAADGDTE